MIFQEMIGHVLQMRNKVSEFSFYPEGSNEGRKTTFLFFCKVFHLNYIYIFRSRQLIQIDRQKLCTFGWLGFCFCFFLLLGGGVIYVQLVRKALHKRVAFAFVCLNRTNDCCMNDLRKMYIDIFIFSLLRLKN